MAPRSPTAALLLALAAMGCGAPTDHTPGPTGRLEVPRQLLASPEARQRGERLYGRYCAGCHGRTGAGDGPRRHLLGTPPTAFTDPGWRAQSSPEAVFRAIRHGVPGTDMPPWRAFTDEDTWALVAWVRSLAPPRPGSGP